MEVWCRDVGDVAGRYFGERTGQRYKALWERYGVTLPPGAQLPPWSESYRVLRDDEGDTPERFEKWDADSLFRRGSPATKAEVFRRLAEDPDVRADKQARSAALASGAKCSRGGEQETRAYWRKNEIAEQEEEKREKIKPVLAVEGAVAECGGAARRFESRIEGLLHKEPTKAGGFLL